ncbi:MAG: hypothetical protein IT374_06700 [Polyangiaceae bacterium]|nr:hypothetical protein [Polyangiaceae bacterium]
MIARRALLSLVPALAACGYRPVRAAEGGAFAVRPGCSTVAEPRALFEVVAGARRALSREGAHDPGSTQTLVVDVSRLDEVTSGLARSVDGVSGRGTTLTLVGRALVEPGGADTGELEVAGESAWEGDPALDAARRAEVVASLGRRLGEAMALTILGLPTTDRARL